MPPELQKELSMLMSPPVIAGVVTWLVSQIVMIILMINHKPKNRKVDEVMKRQRAVPCLLPLSLRRSYERNFSSG